MFIIFYALFRFVTFYKSRFTKSHYFLLYLKVNQLYINIQPPSFGFPSRLGHQTALGGGPCVVQ